MEASLYRKLYWEAQPDALKLFRAVGDDGIQLRDPADPTALIAGMAPFNYAQECAAQGLPVDLNTMLYCADPVQTMRARVVYGYTWVPAMGQPSVTVIPTLASVEQYDPANPPAGSIKVVDPDGSDESIYAGFGLTPPAV